MTKNIEFPSMGNTAIIITGINRYETSLLAGIFYILGVNFGSNLILPDFFNPKGYFEHREILEVNEELLKIFNIKKDGKLDFKLFKGNRYMLIKKKMIKIINNEFSNKDLWCIKDAQLIYLIPIILSILREMNINVKIIIEIGHPIDFINFMNKNFKQEILNNSWIEYNLFAEIVTRNLNRDIFLFDNLVSNPIKTINESAIKFGINFNFDEEKIKLIKTLLADDKLKEYYLERDNKNYFNTFKSLEIYKHMVNQDEDLNLNKINFQFLKKGDNKIKPIKFYKNKTLCQKIKYLTKSTNQ